MSLNADTLIDRIHLKGQIARWRLVAIVVIVLSIIVLTRDFALPGPRGVHIARVTLEGVLMDDVKREVMFREIREDNDIKAVIIRIDSPGGSVMAGEQLYTDLKRLQAVKPTIVVMRTIAASAGYMAALPAERIFAGRGTLTGSIGVIMQGAEITQLAEKLGITPIVLKSAPNKAQPNPFEQLTPEAREVLMETIRSSYDMFVDMVVESRKLDRARVLELADGRVYTGDQALKVGLIDEIGDERQAREWLEKEKKISLGVEVFDHEPKSDEPKTLADLVRGLAGNFSIFQQNRLDGLVSIWQAKPM